MVAQQVHDKPTTDPCLLPTSKTGGEMSLTEQIQTVQDGLFDNKFPPEDLQQVLSNGTHRAVNWRRIRPAVEALKQMPWCNVDTQWDFFLDVERYPVGRPMDLRPDEVGTFQDQTRKGGRWCGF